MGAGADWPEYAAAVDLDRPVVADVAAGHRAELWRCGAADHLAGADDGVDGAGGWGDQPPARRAYQRSAEPVGHWPGGRLA
ncbi:hypothetical protein D3C73_1292220 [compost metagenome]